MTDGLLKRSVSRRGFAAAAASGTVIAGWNAAFGGCEHAAHGARERLGTAIGPLWGALLVDESTCRGYAQDYGGIVHRMPRAVLLPGSVEDVSRVVRFAQREGLRVVARGHGHQPFGQAQVEGGIVIDMRSLRSVLSVSGDQIQVEAGADWRGVVNAAVRCGGSPPVLPAYLGLTVAGTLSIGGIGVGSPRHGAQVEHVTALQVVTGEGDVLDCSRDTNADLFDAALAGQGQCGIITRATLRLVPAPAMVREYVASYSGPTSLLADLEHLSRREHVDGTVGLAMRSLQGWTLAIQVVTGYTPPDVPEDAAIWAGLQATPGSIAVRDAPFLQHLTGAPETPFANTHADIGLFVPGRSAARFVEGILGRANEDDLGAVAALRLFSLSGARFTRPLMKVPADESFVYAAVIRPEATDAGAISRMLNGNRTLFEQNRVLGGTLYPFCALELSRKEWRQHYGDSLRGLVRAKRRFDPAGVFVSGPDWLGRGGRGGAS